MEDIWTIVSKPVQQTVQCNQLEKPPFAPTIHCAFGFFCWDWHVTASSVTETKSNLKIKVFLERSDSEQLKYLIDARILKKNINKVSISRPIGL